MITKPKGFLVILNLRMLSIIKIVYFLSQDIVKGGAGQSFFISFFKLILCCLVTQSSLKKFLHHFKEVNLTRQLIQIQVLRKRPLQVKNRTRPKQLVQIRSDHSVLRKRLSEAEEIKVKQNSVNKVIRWGVHIYIQFIN